MATVIFDWKRTLYDPEKKSLIADGVGVLDFLNAKKINLILIGKGTEEMHKEVARLNVKKYFSKIIFISRKKDTGLFRQFIDVLNPKNTFVIGDRIRSEIEIGNNLKTTTIWISQGKFANELPENKEQAPSYKVKSLSQLKKLLLKIFSIKFIKNKDF